MTACKSCLRTFSYLFHLNTFRQEYIEQEDGEPGDETGGSQVYANPPPRIQETEEESTMRDDELESRSDVPEISMKKELVKKELISPTNVHNSGAVPRKLPPSAAKKVTLCQVMRNGNRNTQR